MFSCMNLLHLSLVFRLLNFFPLLVMNFDPKLSTPLHFYYSLQSNHYLGHERCLFLLILMLIVAQWQGLFKVQLVVMTV